MARRPNGFRIDDPAWVLIQALISYWGITTANGGGGGANLICADLVNQPDFDGNQVVIISGAYGGQARDISGTTLAGTVTPSLAFGGVIPAATIFAILPIVTTPAEVSALTALVQALILDVGDASASTLGSLYAILGDPAQDFNTMVGYQGATALADKLTAARAALLDQITALRMAELDAVNLPADISAILADVTGIAGAAMRGTDNAALAANWTAALAIALGNYTAARAGYLDNLIGAVSSGVFSLVNNVNEQDCIIVAAASQQVDIELDMFNLAQLNTVREYVQVDAANYRQISAKIFPTNFDTGTKSVIISFTQKNSLYKITLQASVLEGGAKNVPWRQMVRPLS